MGRRESRIGRSDRGERGTNSGGKKARKKIDEDEGGGEYDDHRRLADLVDSATNSPLLALDDRSLVSFKALVRRSDANVHAAFDLLYDKLKKHHSQVRYLGLLLMDELFTRSKLFRSLLVPVFENFLLLSVGFRSDYPLPPPQERASVLRKKAIEIVEKWNDMFGQHYKPLRLAHDYLKKTLRFEFPNAREVATLAQQQRRERERRTQDLLKKKLTSLKADYPELRAEIHSTLEQVIECVAILTERKCGDDQQEQFNLDSDEDEFEEYGARNLRSARDEVEEQETIPHETGENEALFDTLRDLYRLLTSRHLVSTQEWLSTLMRVDPEEERQARDTLLRDVIDLRNKLLKAREVCEGAGIERSEGASSKSGADGDADEIIWEEGEVLISNSAISEAIEATSAPAAEADETTRVGAVAEFTAEANKSESEERKESVINEAEETEDTSLKAQLLKEAPVLKWGAFLERWGSDRAIPANNRGLEFENHWGKVDYDVTIPAEKLAESSLNLRAVYYSAEKTEIPPCLAPLRNGGFCPRRDLKRCPFHGTIIPRDSRGKPLEVEKQKPENLSDDSWENKDELDSTIPSESRNVNVELVQQAIANVRQKDEEFKKKVLEDKANVRRERAKRAREHNDACLRAAAIGTSGQGLAEAFGEDVITPESQPKKRRCGLTALLRKKPTAKDRLSRRLLNGRVRDATATQLARDEQAAYRESFPNQCDEDSESAESLQDTCSSIPDILVNMITGLEEFYRFSDWPVTYVHYFSCLAKFVIN
ncbi:hypothetical protein R1flu_021682 [Riccia fluitans]|uniref:UV-stimulated scaffold protein A C-terminal domain-containing protein n=1 Tax=Riccia fluitans TaxID=41844 RepID=A0ABD1ZT92_9MARC